MVFRTNSIKNYKKWIDPLMLKNYNGFWGSQTFFRKFITDLSRVAYLLYQLLRKDKEFEWDDNCEIAFQKMEESLFSDVVLAHPNYESPFYLFTDDSNLGIGASLRGPPGFRVDFFIYRPIFVKFGVHT